VDQHDIAQPILSGRFAREAGEAGTSSKYTDENLGCG
jgi:hypothetical protein